MRYRNNKSRLSRGLTLVEMVIAMAIMAIIFATIVPQFRAIQNSWDSKLGSGETLQNGRVLIDHLNRNLSKAVKITAVSDSSETNGYIEFENNVANNLRYDVNSTTNYVQFGLVGDLSELAGPVSQLQFTCYDAFDINTPITDVNAIRYVKVGTTVTNPASMGQDMTFATQAYIRTNALSSPPEISKLSAPWLEYDTQKGIVPALSQIDQTHYLCAYQGYQDDGWATVLTVDTGTWAITKETPFEFDAAQGETPALAQIDSTHYLCAYSGDKDDGWATVLTVNTGTWEITNETPFEFDTSQALAPALSQIDSTHYLCAYQGNGGTGWAIVLTVDTGTWTITKETPFEYDTEGGLPDFSKIDNTHYLCAYRGPFYDGWAVILTVDTGTWTITKETPFEFDANQGQDSALAKIDQTHYLCVYSRDGYDDTGWATVLTVDTGTWAITNQTPFQFDSLGKRPAVAKKDDTHYLCAYTGPSYYGWSVVLTVDTGNWTVSKETPFTFDVGYGGSVPALAKIDDSHYLCANEGQGDDGFVGVLELSEEIRP